MNAYNTSPTFELLKTIGVIVHEDTKLVLRLSKSPEVIRELPKILTLCIEDYPDFTFHVEGLAYTKRCPEVVSISYKRRLHTAKEPTAVAKRLHSLIESHINHGNDYILVTERF